MISTTALSIEPLHPARYDQALDELGSVLHACVHAGASVGFVLPFEARAARAFWEELRPAVHAGQRLVLAARQGPGIVGTVQLALATAPNGAHRAEVAKLLVHPGARRQGVARALMLALEDVARAHRRRLLYLDTRTGDHAEPLYRSLGYQLAGVIPQFALSPDGSAHCDPTSVMYKLLGPGEELTAAR